MPMFEAGRFGKAGTATREFHWSRVKPIVKPIPVVLISSHGSVCDVASIQRPALSDFKCDCAEFLNTNVESIDSGLKLVQMESEPETQDRQYNRANQTMSKTRTKNLEQMRATVAITKKKQRLPPQR